MLWVCRLLVRVCIPMRTLLARDICWHVVDQAPETDPQFAVELPMGTDDVAQFWMLTEQLLADTAVLQDSITEFIRERAWPHDEPSNSTPVWANRMFIPDSETLPGMLYQIHNAGPPVAGITAQFWRI